MSNMANLAAYLQLLIECAIATNAQGKKSIKINRLGWHDDELMVNPET